MTLNWDLPLLGLRVEHPLMSAAMVSALIADMVRRSFLFVV
jgi:hypothetical protein